LKNSLNFHLDESFSLEERELERLQYFRALRNGLRTLEVKALDWILHVKR